MKILLGWELGGGSGHVRSLRWLAGCLKQRGHQVIFALALPANAQGFGLAGETVIAAPLWPGQRGPLPQFSSAPLSMGEALARSVMVSSEAVADQIRAWRALFAQHDIDLVVADYAPGALLAARGRIPAIAVGVGYTLPPAGREQFPVLRPADRPLELTDQDLLGRVNAALAMVGDAPLARITDIFAADLRLPMTIPILDPYGEHRNEPLLGASLPALISPMPLRGNGIFVHFRLEFGIRPELIEGLAAVGGPGTIYIAGLPANAARSLRAAGYEVTDQPVNLPTVLPRCRAVVHYGGHGLAAAAIAAGLPQVVVSTDFEKWLIGRKIEAEGAGCLLGMRNLALPRFVQALRFVRLAPEPFDKALAIAGEMQPWFSTAPEERAAAILDRFLGVSCSRLPS